MRTLSATLALLLTACAIGNTPLAPHAPLQGPFSLVRVSDGDTIVLNMGGLEERVRLIGIDAPERDTPFGPPATAFMRELLRPGAVWLELDARERDRFGRLLAYVYVEDTTGCISNSGDRKRPAPQGMMLG